MALRAWAGDSQLTRAGVRGRALVCHHHSVRLLGANYLCPLDSETGVVHLEGEGGGLQKNVLERDGDAGACTDGKGALGFGRKAGANEREDIVTPQARGQSESGAGLAQLARLEVNVHPDISAGLGARGCRDAPLHRVVWAVRLGQPEARNTVSTFLIYIPTVIYS